MASASSAAPAGALLILYLTVLLIALFNLTASQASEKQKSQLRDGSVGDQVSGTTSFLLARGDQAVSV